MIRLRTILASGMLCVAAIAFADGNITGKVISKDTGEPVDFATVQLLTSAGKPLTIGTNTDENGVFTLPKVKSGSYIVKISNVGSIEQERAVKVGSENINVGTISLADDSKLLQEVVVEGIRSQMRFELDKKVFSVDASIASAGQSASELLENIPSVEVDQDGEVSLRGNSSVTVWINGKESGLTADNRAQILEQIPAETIEKIEVITNPSAKYSPEGTAGIINIVLKKDRKGGYFGSAEVSATSRGGGNASFNFNYNSPKWETYASVGFRMRHNTGGSEIRRDYGDGYFMNADGTSPNHGNNIFLRLGATYHITDNDAIGINGFGMFGHRWGKSSTLYTSNLPGQWISDLNDSHNKGNSRGTHGELTYNHTFSESHTLDITAGFNYWGGPSWNSYSQNYTYPDDIETVEFEENTYQEQEQKINTRSWEAKVDYSNVIREWLKIEAGFQGNYNNEDTPVTTLQGSSPFDMELNPKLWNRFIYHNNISALYVTLGGRVKNFSYSAGLRGEAWQVETKSLTYEQRDNKQDTPWYKKDFFSLFPSVFLSYSLPKDNEVQINYTRRIRRPWGGQLNSFVDISNPTNYSYGNPELEPQYANSFELNYLKSWTYHMLSLSAYVRTADNCMNRLTYRDNDQLYSTWGNAASTTDLGVEIVGKNSLFNGKLDLTTTVNLYNNHISDWRLTLPTLDHKTVSISGDSRSSFAWDARLMANVKLPWSLSFQATGRYASSQLSAQGTRFGGWSVDAGLRRVFGDWSVSVNCRDLFDSRRMRSTTFGDGYYEESKRWRGGRTVRLTIKYSFGNMKQKPGKQRPEGGESMDSGSDFGEME